MPTNPADGPILGTLYGSDAMRAVFDERAYFQRMLDVEAALAQVQGGWGSFRRKRRGRSPRPPPGATTAHRSARRERAKRRLPGGRPGRGTVRGAGEAGGWTHWGATTQDIMDTATVLQVRAGLWT